MAVQPHFLGSMTLKALLEDPNLKNPPLLQSSDGIKVKKEDKDYGIPQINYGSAFLGANLWDKSYGNIDFNLEYMDLDEFLSENAIDSEEMANKNVPAAAVSSKEELVNVPSNSGNNLNLPSSPRQYLRTPPISPTQFLTQPNLASSSSNYPAAHPQCRSPSDSGSAPASPFSVEFQVSEQDLALSSIPDYTDGYRPKWQVLTKNGSDECSPHNGQHDFDPRKTQFSEEELKPQPIIKKSKKVFVPDAQKDDKYWARRHKNNYAAKRSRDARRVKENQIALRASFLEKENSCLREEVNKLRKENAKLRSKNSDKPIVAVELPIPAPSSPISFTSLAFS